MAGEGVDPQKSAAQNDSYEPLPKDIPGEIEVVIVNMEKLLFEGQAKSIVIPIGPNQMLAILPGHTPLFTKLEQGNLVINKEGEKPIEIPISGGLAKITQLKAVILADYKV